MSQGVTWESNAVSPDSAVLGCRRNPEPWCALENDISGLCRNEQTTMVTCATSRRSKPQDAMAGVVAGHRVLAFWPLHKPSLTGCHLSRLVVQREHMRPYFSPDTRT